MGGRCNAIRGATRRQYRLGADDVGRTLALAVRASDSKGATNGYASLIGPVAGRPARLASVVQPAVTGPNVLGGAVHVDAGKWTPAPRSVAYQWIRCNAHGRACAPIAGETSDTHKIVQRDVAHALVAIVQATRGAAAAAVFSIATAPVTSSAEPEPAPSPSPSPTPSPNPPAGSGPTQSTPPAIGQLVQQGKQLTGGIGSWSGSGAIRYAYQWYRCDATGAHCNSIHGATKSTYRQVAKDVGQLLGFAVRASDQAGTTTGYASLIGPVAAANATLVSAGQPLVSGTPMPGQTLQVAPGAWNQVPAAYGYQWQRCNANGRLCTPIDGATAPSYVVAPADTAHALVAVVRVTLGDASQEAWSRATPVVASLGGPVASPGPTVAGIAQVGKQLTGNAGIWVGSGTISYSYQWYRCDPSGAHCLSIHGATKPTYTQVVKDVGQTLGFAVHATDSAGSVTAYASLIGPVAEVAKELVAIAQPTVSGTPKPGQAIQASSGNWSQPPTAVSFQWERCNANGRLCTVVIGATGADYTVSDADIGHALVAVVLAQVGGIAQASVSLASPPV
jgi:hypothetical protein